MPYNFSNFRPTAVVLNPGVNDAVIPAGWSGPLSLTGAVSVHAVSGSSVQTNITEQTGTGVCLFTCSVNSPYSVIWTGGGSPLAVGSGSVVQVLGEGGGSIWADVFTVPDAYSVHHAFTVSSLDPLALGYTSTTNGWGSLTNYVTNANAGELLGTYTGAPGVASVEVDSSGVRVADYSGEEAAAMQGFIVGIGIHCFLWVVRLLKALGNQNLD